MGLSTSGDEYNRRGDEALQTAPSTVKVVDDILSYEADYQQHLNNGHLPELRRAVILTEKDVVKRRE